MGNEASYFIKPSASDCSGRKSRAAIKESIMG